MRDGPYPEGDAKVKWVTTEWLQDHLDDDDIMLLDTQPDVHDYILEHLPGSVYLNQRTLRAPLDGMPGIYVPGEVVSALFGRVGLRPDLTVVVYGGVGGHRGWGDGLGQTMMAYSLARFGHDNVMVLDGGIDKWRAEDRPLTKEFPRRGGTGFPVLVRNGYFIDMAAVRANKDRDDVVLLDARPPGTYQGQGPWRKPGHIPGAVNLPWKDLMTEDNRTLLRPDDEIQALLEGSGVHPDRTIICSCGTGREATNEFILLKWYLGYEDVRLYEGSFLEWSAHPDNPTVTGPGPY